MSRGHAFRRGALAAFLLAGVLALPGCETIDESARGPTLDSGPRAIAAAGIAALQENRLRDASLAFNAALKLDIRSSSLQFLNGYAYHLRAVREDPSLFDMAEQGYRLAIQFDNTNWLARYQLGLLSLDRRDYEKAKLQFADALLYNDRDPDLLYNLAVASYYARDPVTAAGALTRLHQIEPDSARALRASTLVMAALGRSDEAGAMLARYAALKLPEAQTRLVRARLGDWERFHARVRTASFRVPAPRAPVRRPQTQLAQAPNPFAPFPDANAPADSGAPPDTGNAVPAADAAATGEGAAQAGDASEKMVIVDVVIVSSQEDISTAKGLNLLSGLQVLFGQGTSASSPSGPAFTAAVTNTTGAAASTVISRAITIPAVAYSLNIANAGTTRNEILARPSLVATSGQTSVFFSGENIKASSVSTTAQQGATDVEKDIGVKLGVTPEFLDAGRIRLKVEAERTFLQTPSSSVTFDFQLRTSKTTVSANVVMNLGETLILSGLSEKETENVRSGVPGLQEIPAVQYLFSRHTTRDFNKSVLILLTPRAAEYTFRPREVREREKARLSPQERVLSELQSRYGDWFRPYPNWASVFRHLQENPLYREFRTGDVTLERWETQTEAANRLKTLPDFLHY
jgi:general secretion pathway protein D